MSPRTKELSLLSKGNNFADILANQYRLAGQARYCDYFITAEEQFIFVHDKKNIQGDSRQYLKNLERESMLTVWRKKETQGRYISQFPTQVLAQAKLIWRWAVEGGD